MSRSVGQFLRRLGIRAPWEFTGPVSSPEYLPHLPKATEYRSICPTSHPVKAAVPYAEPDRVYDVRYYPRDTRRAELPGGSKKVEVKEWKLGEEREKKEQARGAAAGTPHRWGQFRSILDHDNNGYTV